MQFKIFEVLCGVLCLEVIIRDFYLHAPLTGCEAPLLIGQFFFYLFFKGSSELNECEIKAPAAASLIDLTAFQGFFPQIPHVRSNDLHTIKNKSLEVDI